MESRKPSPLVAIVGQTASGKTSLALQLAKQFDGEIIAADSRTIYKGMDIGTAKPTNDERMSVPHHLVDIINPDDDFNVQRFQHAAYGAIDDIAARGKLPFLVGGTGLYVDAVVYGFSFAVPPRPDLRSELEGLSVEELQQRLIARGLPLPSNARNPRHLIGAIERDGIIPEQKGLRANTLILGMHVERDELGEKIRERVQRMVADGLVEEVRNLYARYGDSLPSMQSDAYRAFVPYIRGDITLEAAIKSCVQFDLQYAKRQKTWFKRNKSIHWISKPEEAVDLITTKLNK